MSTIAEVDTLTASVGFLGKNQPSDVLIVRDLLNKVGFESHPLQSSVCSTTWPGAEADARLVSQIKAFQNRRWLHSSTKPDPIGTIRPEGPTIDRLRTLANGFTLKKISRVSVLVYSKWSPFGYEIKHRGEIPQDGPFKVWLRVSTTEFSKKTESCLSTKGLDVTQACLDVARQQRSALITFENFADFMTILDEQSLWTTDKVKMAYAALFVENKDNFKTISISDSVPFECPIKPWDGRLPDLLGGRVTELWYNKCFLFIHKGADRDAKENLAADINGKYYFVSERDGCRLAIQSNERALNCISFIAGVYKVSPATGQTQTSAGLAAKISNNATESTNMTPQQVKQYFQTHQQGYYMMRTESLPVGGHCVLVVDGAVCEFTALNDNVIKQNGFVRTASINDWPLFMSTMTYTVTPLPAP